MKSPAKPNTWVEDLIEVYNDLGGSANYEDVYPLAQKKVLLQAPVGLRQLTQRLDEPLKIMPKVRQIFAADLFFTV
jgi:hypothetical protein